MNPNRLETTCDKCGAKAVIEVVPDGWDDAPERFTITRTCSGACPKSYRPVTSSEMHEITGLPLSGWSS